MKSDKRVTFIMFFQLFRPSFAEALESSHLFVEPWKIAKTSGKSYPGLDPIRSKRLLEHEQPQVQTLAKHDLKFGKHHMAGLHRFA